MENANASVRGTRRRFLGICWSSGTLPLRAAPFLPPLLPFLLPSLDLLALRRRQHLHHQTVRFLPKLHELSPRRVGSPLTTNLSCPLPCRLADRLHLRLLILGEVEIREHSVFAAVEATFAMPAALRMAPAGLGRAIGGLLCRSSHRGGQAQSEGEHEGGARNDARGLHGITFPGRGLGFARRPRGSRRPAPCEILTAVLFSLGTRYVENGKVENRMRGLTGVVAVVVVFTATSGSKAQPRDDFRARVAGKLALAPFGHARFDGDVDALGLSDGMTGFAYGAEVEFQKPLHRIFSLGAQVGLLAWNVRGIDADFGTNLLLDFFVVPEFRHGLEILDFDVEVYLAFAAGVTLGFPRAAYATERLDSGFGWGLSPTLGIRSFLTRRLGVLFEFGYGHRSFRQDLLLEEGTLHTRLDFFRANLGVLFRL